MAHYAFLAFDPAGHVYGIIHLLDKLLQCVLNQIRQLVNVSSEKQIISLFDNIKLHVET